MDKQEMQRRRLKMQRRQAWSDLVEAVSNPQISHQELSKRSQRVQRLTLQEAMPQSPLPNSCTSSLWQRIVRFVTRTKR